MKNSELVAQMAEQCADEVLEKHMKRCEAYECHCRVDEEGIRAAVERYMLRLVADVVGAK